MRRAEALKQKYGLQRHPEGGWFAEAYTCGFEQDGRPLMGSIYFLLEGDEISHFHQIDCDEIWYYHEGSPLKITEIVDGALRTTVIGPEEEQSVMAVIPRGAIFAAENVDRQSYCLISCATAPQFRYVGFRLVGRAEIQALLPSEYGEVSDLAYPDPVS